MEITHRIYSLYRLAPSICLLLALGCAGSSSSLGNKSSALLTATLLAKVHPSSLYALPVAADLDIKISNGADYQVTGRADAEQSKYLPPERDLDADVALLRSLAEQDDGITERRGRADLQSELLANVRLDMPRAILQNITQKFLEQRIAQITNTERLETLDSAAAFDTIKRISDQALIRLDLRYFLTSDCRALHITANVMVWLKSEGRHNTPAHRGMYIYQSAPIADHKNLAAVMQWVKNDNAPLKAALEEGIGEIAHMVAVEWLGKTAPLPKTAGGIPVQTRLDIPYLALNSGAPVWLRGTLISQTAQRLHLRTDKQIVFSLARRNMDQLHPAARASD